MCSRMMSAVRGLVLVGLANAAGAGVLLAQSTTRVSVDSQGGQANGACGFSTISADGRFVAFLSDADNLVPGDTNGMLDVFLHDRQTGETTRVSVDSKGGQGNGDSGCRIGFSCVPALSADGQLVAFVSNASNLVSGDTNNVRDVFLHDRLTGETTRVSVDSQGGEANGVCDFPALSADGRIVAFASDASNLMPGDTNNQRDVFVHDCQTGETTCVSVDSAGEHANGTSDAPDLSADGRFVAFASTASNLVPGDFNNRWDIFVHDCQTGETVLVSVDSEGRQAQSHSEEPALSADGRFVAFTSSASNLVPGDTNGYTDIFVHDRETGETTRVSVDSQGGQADYYSNQAAISADGRIVAFTSLADNLVPGIYGGWSVFIHDRQTGETTRASVNSDGREADGSSGGAILAGDGRLVAFASDAENLVSDDTNAVYDCFVHDLTAEPCTLPSYWSSYGSGYPGGKGIPAIIAASNPLLCTTLLVSADNSAGVDTPGFLLAGLWPANLTTAWGGTLLVRPTMVTTVLVPATGFSVSAPIPCDDSLCGLALYVQVLELDPGAARGVSFTRGLELRLSVQ